MPYDFLLLTKYGTRRQTITFPWSGNSGEKNWGFSEIFEPSDQNGSNS
jgi:hypothetical protein